MAPSAIILSEPDAILTLGALVAQEMAWPVPGLFRLPIEQQTAIPADAELSITPDGRLRVVDPRESPPTTASMK
jgi:predicted aconitase with swiveling domain